MCVLQFWDKFKLITDLYTLMFIRMKHVNLKRYAWCLVPLVWGAIGVWLFLVLHWSVSTVSRLEFLESESEFLTHLNAKFLWQIPQKIFIGHFTQKNQSLFLVKNIQTINWRYYCIIFFCISCCRNILIIIKGLVQKHGPCPTPLTLGLKVVYLHQMFSCHVTQEDACTRLQTDNTRQKAELDVCFTQQLLLASRARSGQPNHSICKSAYSFDPYFQSQNLNSEVASLYINFLGCFFFLGLIFFIFISFQPNEPNFIFLPICIFFLAQFFSSTVLLGSGLSPTPYPSNLFTKPLRGNPNPCANTTAEFLTATTPSSGCCLHCTQCWHRQFFTNYSTRLFAIFIVFSSKRLITEICCFISI